MDLNDFYHESFKKWLKGKCSPQAEVVSNSYDGEGISAEYSTTREGFIIYPHEREYPLVTVKESLHSEELFNALVTEMMSSRTHH